MNNRREKNRIRSIITDFFAYWADDKVETRMIDTVTQLLIKHSISAKEKDANYLTAAMSVFDSLYATDQLNLDTMIRIMNDYITNVRREVRNQIFGWECLIIVFTMGHDLLMKFPHLYLDIVDMLFEVFYLAGDDFEALGGWDNFIHYSGTIFGFTI